jgi:cysteinyl-tRNA synthetase
MIRVYSTEARTKEPFEPIDGNRVRMYVCGPTVYDACHVGHARPAVVFDTVRRYLEYAGYSVLFVSNITDIDDKIIQRARELGTDWRLLASRYQDEYERDMAALGVRSPTVRPKATEHIGAMIDLVRRLEETGYAYATSRGVWFDVSRWDRYGHVSGRKRDDETTEHRVETDPEKRNPQDFALWKFSKPGEPEWESPWGAGRPGWHIECSAMSGVYCDWRLDIHGGGADLTFPHHENEAAQSEAVTGETFVTTWMHNGFITVAKEEDETGEKMGKSKGNAFWLRAAFRQAPPAALRLWILGTHYRMPLLYKPDALTSAVASLDRIYTALEALDERAGDAAPPPEGEAGDALQDLRTVAESAFRAAMDDDFNTPQALAAVYDLVKNANRALAEGVEAPAAHRTRLLLRSLVGTLGLPYERPETGSRSVDDFVAQLVAERTAARERKDFEAADRIRDRLAALGVELNDRGGETTWRLG